MIASVTLTREPLQLLKVDAIGYGAKDTGEMGGGAAAAVLAAAGPELLTALQTQFTSAPRRVGDVFITPSGLLQTQGIRWVLHIISIIKYTPQGAYCPEPPRLRDGVLAALKVAADNGAQSVGLAAMGTGEGRVEPRDAARYMLAGVQAFRQSRPASSLPVTFSLPTYRDFEAFRAALQQS